MRISSLWDEIDLAWAKWGFLRRILRYGWTGNYIPATDSETSFAYSIGLWEHLDAPELIVFGADPEVSHGLLKQAHAELRTGQLKLADKAPWRLGGNGGPRLVWRAVHPSQIRAEYFSVAIWYRQHRKLGREGFSAFQLVISDENGVMPWEEGLRRRRSAATARALPAVFPEPADDKRGGRKPPRHLHQSSTRASA